MGAMIKVFMGGSRAVAKLDKQVMQRIATLVAKEFTILVGDADGVDLLVQRYLNGVQYKNVQVYASAGRARHNVGDWPVVAVDASGAKSGFEFYAAKDMQMVKDTTYGFMIWDGKTRGTLSNITNLSKLGKWTVVYFIPKGCFFNIEDKESLDILLRASGR